MTEPDLIKSNLNILSASKTDLKNCILIGHNLLTVIVRFPPLFMPTFMKHDPRSLALIAYSTTLRRKRSQLQSWEQKTAATLAEVRVRGEWEGPPLSQIRLKPPGALYSFVISFNSLFPLNCLLFFFNVRSRGLKLRTKPILLISKLHQSLPRFKQKLNVF